MRSGYSYLGLASLAGSGAAIFVPWQSRTRGVAVPCPTTFDCGQIARLPISKIYGLPVDVLGIVVIGLALGLALFRPTGSIAAIVAGCATLIAMRLQLLLQAQYRVLCPWCLGATVGLVAATLLLWIGRGEERDWTSTSIALGLGVLPALLGATVLSEASWAAKSLAVPTREELTLGGSTDLHLQVVFASPNCPACARKIEGLLANPAKGITTILRFMPLTRTNEELRVAARMLYAYENGQRPHLAILLTSSPELARIMEFDRKVPVGPREMTAYTRKAISDKAVGRQIGIQRLPFAFDCPPRSECKPD